MEHIVGWMINLLAATVVVGFALAAAIEDARMEKRIKRHRPVGTDQHHLPKAA